MGSKVSLKIKLISVIFLSLFLLGMEPAPPLVGSPAPLFELKTLDNQTVKLTDYKGQFIVLNFWATWCAPCIKEMPELQNAYRSLKDNNVKVIGVNFAESKTKVDHFIKDHGLNFPVLLDNLGNVAQDYEVLNLPITYFITPDGFVRDKIFGGGITQKIIDEKIKQLS